MDEWRVDKLTSCLFCWKQWRTCRDRRPRLSAPIFYLTLQAASPMRTDEGVCPYFVTTHPTGQGSFWILFYNL
ncbi:hypothetical protein HMPREF0973_00036 [Prevotella veroralis F0319]|uniref:Uncharacterized protein n=1 Tax=Prevotella veroralis F0319 TaxID=649761 RepID=C9MKB7_9BACT|nr:hypothetical protein HMPREF0973_00036 [Prevotella veroralis F0319]